MTGKLIVFEGVEGCGKTTQIVRSHQWLQTTFPQAKVVVTREPGDTHLGLELRQILLAKTTEHPISELAELLLYAADRAQHVAQVLKPNLADNAIILCDRYTDSTIAYQGYGRGLERKIIDQLNLLATGGLESDLTLWLDVDVEISLLRIKSRGASDRIEQANLAFHQRVQAGYTQLAAANPQRIERIDASLSEVAVAAQIQNVLLKYFDN
ncbi:dTMP kinase [Aliterella atlantica]|uniref:Thymidylate kinase n=1 Tax=Aliterella atlantica CENA595 TaxID=1618023 RepID=A0A0D8ZVJ6_9CYAN|nr:dTMP kinase [Aliterella atlantica]KJH72793.1 thymidylate kinase [Aliterella atlantica CENA595]